MKTDLKELIDNLAKLAKWSEEEKKAVLSKLGEDTVIEGDLGKGILSKFGAISTREFLLNDPNERKALYDEVMGIKMPKIEEGTRDVFLSIFGDFVKDSDIDPIWKDEKNGKLNDKVKVLAELLKTRFGESLDGAKLGDDELRQERDKFKGLYESTQSKLDGVSSSNQDAIKALERKHEVDLFGFKLINDMTRLGADVSGMERGIAMQISEDYHVGLDEQGKPYLRNKQDPTLKITDKESGTTLGYEDVLRRDFSKLFKRNSGDGGGGQGGDGGNRGGNGGDKGGRGSGTPGEYPENIKSARQRRLYDKMQGRLKQREEASNAGK